MANTAVELAIVLTAKDLASAELNKVSGKLGGMGDAAKVAIGAVAAVATAVIGGVTTAIAFADAAANAAGEVRKLARETGLTAEEASKLRYAGERLNISTDDLSKSFGLFSKNLETNQKKLDEYGIATIRNADGTVDLGNTLDSVADKFKNMPDGVEKTNLALQLFGRSGKDMIPFLNQGSEGLHKMGDEAKKVGLVFSKDGVDAAFKYGQAQKDLSDQFEGLRNKIGMALMPVLTNLFSFLAKVAETVLPPLIEGVTGVWKIFSEVFDVLTGRAPDAGAALTNALGPDAAKAIMGAVAGVRDMVQALTKGLQDFVTWLNSSDDAAKIVRDILGFLATAIGTILKTAVDNATRSFHLMADIIRGIGPALNEVGILFDDFKLLVLTIWRGIVTGIASAVNGVIGVINGFIEGYNQVAEKLGLPLLGTISLITPNLDQIDAAINQVARDRASHITVTTDYLTTGDPRGIPQAAGGDYMVTKPTLFLAGEAGPERATFTPLSKMDSGGGGDTTIITVQGSLIGLSVNDLARALNDLQRGNERRRGVTLAAGLT